MINPEKMRYQRNRFSFYFCLLAIVFNVVAMLWIYTSSSIKPTYLMGVDVLINICFMLFVFLTSERTKAYHIKWSYACYVGAAFQIVRMFVLPLVNLVEDKINILTFLAINEFYLYSAACLVAAGVMCYIKSKALNNYLASLTDEGSLHN